ncbi:MAG: ABC transporter permease [Actinomycetota bacterium]|nr:ABC transporter permease [Actinomycetota bacterium]
MTTTAVVHGGIRRRISSFFFRHDKTRRALTLSAPLLWMIVVYFISLALLLANSVWKVDSLTGDVIREWTTRNYDTVFSGRWQTAFLERTYFVMAWRTALIAALVTLADVAFAFPIAYYASRIATPRARSAIMIAVVIPLWANYLIRVFAWKAIIQGGGPAEALLHVVGLSNISLIGTPIAMWITFCYLWLPYAILPIVAALERVPSSYIEASGDLGAHARTTFRRVVFPLAIPGIVAGSIFTFSLTLGDYIVPDLVGKGSFLGNGIAHLNVNNRPLAATIAVVAMTIVFIYLALAKRTGAFEAL